MRLVTFESDVGRRVGALSAGAEGVHDLTSELPPAAGMLEVIEQWSELGPVLSRALTRLPVEPWDDVVICAPIPVPRRNIICVGQNYYDHASEFSRSGFDRSGGAEIPAKPVVFTKAPSSVVGSEATVELHHGITEQVDYEAELVAVIGTAGRGIRASDADRHVWGYTAMNDVTARDLQRDHKQWFLGKSLDGFCPLGPWISTADEIDVRTLELECRVNSELRQKASVADLIFDIPTLIETVSAAITLQPGDMIATGTPAGVGIGSQPPRFLSTGDVVEVSITGLGCLRNQFQ